MIPLIILSAALLAMIIIVAVLLRRISEYKKIQEKIRSRVNHDLRSPLNAVLGFSDLLMQTEKDQEKIKFLTAIKSGGQTLLALIEEMAKTIKQDTTQVGVPSETLLEGNQRLKSINSLENDTEALIMIVDDMIENVIFLEQILQKSGFRTISAQSGDAALDLLTEYTPDLILLDIVMHGISGFETCARIQSNKDFIDIPVIFLGARKDEKTIIESFIYGGLDYVVKPFNSPELLARVNTHLQLKKAKEKLHILAFTDMLTGLYNRRKFFEVLDQEQSRVFRYKEDSSFIMIDIDHFKRINDEYGHDTGDKALIRFADIVKSALRETDHAGRLGGEEFGIILPQTGIENALIVAERIRTGIEKETGKPGEDIPAFTASFGVAQFNKERTSATLLTQEVDRALYRAKETGRNRVCRAGSEETMINYSLIAAISDNLVIGKDNTMPWHVPEDLKLFKRLTTGNIIIMGRKTFESVGKPLPGRTTIVITSNPGDFSSKYSNEKLMAVDSLEAALKSASEIPEKQIFVAGGARVYTQAISGAQKLYLSRIKGEFEGDAFFPNFNNGNWVLESDEEQEGFRLEIYRKKA